MRGIEFWSSVLAVLAKNRGPYETRGGARPSDATIVFVLLSAKTRDPKRVARRCFRPEAVTPKPGNAALPFAVVRSMFHSLQDCLLHGSVRWRAFPYTAYQSTLPSCASLV